MTYLTYRAAFDAAQAAANLHNADYGLSDCSLVRYTHWPDKTRTERIEQWCVNRLPWPCNRTGSDLRCQVVRPDVPKPGYNGGK